MNESTRTAAPTWLRLLIVATGAVWCGIIGFFLGFLLADGMGWIQMKRLGNVADAPPPDFPQWLAWAVPLAAGIVAAWAGGRLGGMLACRIGEVGRSPEQDLPPDP